VRRRVRAVRCHSKKIPAGQPLRRPTCVDGHADPSSSSRRSTTAAPSTSCMCSA
jgi:hypothetical protein